MNPALYIAIGLVLGLYLATNASPEHGPETRVVFVDKPLPKNLTKPTQTTYQPSQIDLYQDLRAQNQSLAKLLDDAQKQLDQLQDSLHVHTGLGSWTRLGIITLSEAGVPLVHVKDRTLTIDGVLDEGRFKTFTYTLPKPRSPNGLYLGAAYQFPLIQPGAILKYDLHLGRFNVEAMTFIPLLSPTETTVSAGLMVQLN